MKLFRKHKKLTAALRESVERYLDLYLEPAEEAVEDTSAEPQAAGSYPLDTEFVGAGESASFGSAWDAEESEYWEDAEQLDALETTGEFAGLEPKKPSFPIDNEVERPWFDPMTGESLRANEAEPTFMPREDEGFFEDAVFGMAPEAAPQPQRSAAPASAPMPHFGGRAASAAPEHVKSKAPSMTELNTILNSTETTFSDTLLQLIDAHGKSDAQVYKRARISRKLFSKIRGNANYQPSKRTVLALAVALELDVDATASLLAKAGFAFSPASKADLIVRYFIECKNYDTFLIDETLLAFDQPLLFS